MKILKFKLSGDHAFFKKPDVNTYYYFTYGHIHKIALLGIFGAIMGYGGYSQQKDKDVYPEFYEKLKHIKVGIQPYKHGQAHNGYFTKKIQTFNNTVGYANTDGNLIVKEQWLENPSWNIYMIIEGETADKLCKSIINSHSVFVPYLGKNDHMANISEIQILEGESINLSEPIIINSLYLKDHFNMSIEDINDLWSSDYNPDSNYRYEEKLPAELDEETNQYIIRYFVYTNKKVELKEDVNESQIDVLKCCGSNIYFF
ncbi:hypothetical protein GCM10023142_29420 [Anaerocolumna aminovalerica]|uniref:CRISPR-associated protein Cas5h n=1 Tax=Anaerocolumna aminovalerica TaxID=1527 RepID=A0A1I5IHL2_9FIRM|nr:type I-B CRISPR-associated protein Cas5b [Anaerocolumna aminovalerica]MDU6265696.1 type I-B CRISPR-associated protein Cas5b [Anaerocolumna aminovalerica]SFO59914.1 CRISPR-associated protein Cas5h [Anaerocolumna aminovalerica]